MKMTDESMSVLSKALRAIASIMQTPVIILLLLLIVITVLLAGWLIGEFFTERRHLKVELPALVDRINESEGELEECINSAGLLKRQREALLELTKHPDLTDLMRESLAVRLLQTEQEHYDRRVRISDMIAKIGPILGLLGTLIPLGPGIIALGQGDTVTLSSSLLTAFDTTVAGLLAAGIAMVISSIRNAWYGKYMSILETLMECILEVEKRKC
jgi:biopolymer transport protein ExbB/TolQ